jgi:hypothetical protein
MLSNTRDFSNQCIVVFAHKHETASKLEKFFKSTAVPCETIDEHTNAMRINAIIKDWEISMQGPNTMTRSDSFASSLSLSSNKQYARVLICTDKIINFVNIRNATCIIHFDFPASKDILAKRLWFMRDNFKFHRKMSAPLNDDSEATVNPSERPDDYDPIQVQNPLSYILFTKDEYKYSQGFLKYLLRVGVDESALPETLKTMATNFDASKEAMRIGKPLCPYIKSYGKCVSPLRNCECRHFLCIQEDGLRQLSSGNMDKLLLPNEGFVQVLIPY